MKGSAHLQGGPDPQVENHLPKPLTNLIMAPQHRENGFAVACSVSSLDLFLEPWDPSEPCLETSSIHATWDGDSQTIP